MSATLTQAVRRLLGMALQAYGGHPETAALLHRQLARLDEPLRVAIAGRVKAGKSTLLNALVGDLLAPTDAGECTKVVTWFRDGRTPRVVMHPLRGPAVPLTVAREDGALVIDLGTTPAEELDRVVVDWPSSGLRTLTLIDTPGIASLTTENSRRTVTFLDPDDESPTEADAVVYLMRHLHTADAEFLESFRDQGVARAATVNAMAVISRADEIGAGRVDAMFSARAIAQRYRGEPAVRALCQDVVAVAGLLAQTGRTLRQAEYQALAALAEIPREELDRSLMSVDRFLGGEPLATGTSREQLLRRFGMYGIRLAVSLIRQGTRTADAMATELVDRSGLPELQRVLRVQFAERRDVLKARSALLAIESVLRADGRPGPLAAELERVLAGAHEFTELRALGALRAGAVRLPKDLVGEAERLLGDSGRGAAARLGLPGDADAGSVRAAAGAAVARWQRHAANPMFRRNAADVCRVVVRTCEGLLVTSGGGRR
ncbi:dynamin family protein [Pseudonocardia sp. DSM 110487]|uniref:dynamin family protein n=1 Tax=Pseudonocardia sp. DSM 110487 TaxID=2865833 RepID=UPI001C69CAA5|nr:dynamin family protein [Pseudonocardia sp. DSM 110487]QYN34177.1 dynamin family protein [Pseudonocardia sp. DSM 110487]